MNKYLLIGIFFVMTFMILDAYNISGNYLLL